MLRHRGTCDETPSSDERRHQTARENGSEMTQKQTEGRPSGDRAASEGIPSGGDRR